jgi:Fe-S-cluster containining protein
MTQSIDKSERDFFVLSLKEEARRAIWDVRANVDAVTLIESVLNDLEALAPRTDGTEERTDEEIRTQIRQRLIKAAYATRPHCVRCGTCCTKGSPTLLREDMELFVRDILGPSDVFTVRKGEAAYSNVTDSLAPAEEEMIKIREKPDENICIFYREGDKECSIYESRPLQCRAQECWNPDAHEEVAAAPRLSRREILAHAVDLMRIVERHEDRCSYQELERAIARLSATKGQTVGEIIDLLSFDEHVREFAADQFGLDEESLDFFFGRPLSQTIEAYGLKVKAQPDGTLLLTPIESPQDFADEK